MPFRIWMEGRELQIDPEKIPYTEHGRPGSILDLALGHGVRLNHTCGGVCSCTTCHIHVKSGLESCNPPDAAELNRLDEVYGRTEQSRLACQCVPEGTGDLEIEIP